MVVTTALKMIMTYIAQMIAAAISHGTAKGGVLGGFTEYAGAMALIGLIPSVAFADGGIAYGPTMGLVGEYPGARTNPEVIAPLSKLKEMIGGGVNRVEVVGVIRGEDIHYVVNQQTSKLARYR